MDRLPVEVLYENILPHLKWNDLLRLRRVSKRTKWISDTFISSGKFPVPDSVIIELNNSGCDKSLKSFLQLGYPATRFIFNNADSGQRFFEGEAASQFQKLYANRITHIQVSRFSLYRDGAERSFYQSLQHLRSLEIQALCWRDKDQRRAKTSTLRLQNLRASVTSLKINSAVASDIRKEISSRYWKKFKNLREFAPSSIEKRCNWAFYFTEFSYYLSPHRQCNLECVDLKYCHVGRSPSGRPSASKLSPFLVNLCEKFAEHGIKLRNVPARLLNRFDSNNQFVQTISSVVESLDGLHPVLRDVPLPHLKILTIDTKLQPNSIFPYHKWLTFDTSWMALEKLDLSVSSWFLRRCMRQGQYFPETPVAELYKLLFGSGERRENLTSLRIYFYPFFRYTLPSDPTGYYPCPRISEILSSCPNLVKLDITNWPDGDDLVFSMLWGGLRLLEEVTLTKCKHLGDDGFIGGDPKYPAFLNLTRLKKVRLRSLEKMPKVTDKSFQSVFRHLKINHFDISSKKPIKNVTAQGIRSLLSGDFNKSIESFPFANWSLSELKRQQFTELATQFRSSHML